MAITVSGGCDLLQEGRTPRPFHRPPRLETPARSGLNLMIRLRARMNIYRPLSCPHLLWILGQFVLPGPCPCQHGPRSLSLALHARGPYLVWLGRGLITAVWMDYAVSQIIYTQAYVAAHAICNYPVLVTVLVTNRPTEVRHFPFWPSCFTSIVRPVTQPRNSQAQSELWIGCR